MMENFESTFDEVGVSKFEWFGGYDWETFENCDLQESPIESETIQILDKDYIDKLVSDGDYFWLDEYLQKLDEKERSEAYEHISQVSPDFLDDEEWAMIVQMKWSKRSKEEIAENLKEKPHFNNRVDIQDKLWDALLNSYRDAA